MSATKPESLDLLETFVHLGHAGTATPLEVNESFWADLTSGKFDALGGGRLVSSFAFEDDWDAWERHPAGDELVFLVSGDLEFVLELPGGPASVRLQRPGACAVVPRDTWHTARVHAPSHAIFVTDGEGTEHRPA